jgi:D-tyrosyl-tRNA(Tyr) deacylase
MRVLIQRVKEASVKVDGKIVGSIKQGMLIFFGASKEDAPEKTLWLAKKIALLRMFRDSEDKMNLDLKQIEGRILVISQFTLYGDCNQGRRPDFTQAAPPDSAKLMYEKFIGELSTEIGDKVETGIFGAYMEVALVNDGPVTFLIER